MFMRPNRIVTLRVGTCFLLAMFMGGALAVTGCNGNESKASSAAVSATPDPEGPKTTPTNTPTSKPASNPPSDTVTFKKKSPPIGAKRVTTQSLNMTLDLNIGAGAAAKVVHSEKIETIERNEEILAVDGDAVTKVKVTYTSKTDVAKDAGRRREKKFPFVGKPYVVEAKDGKVVVLTEAGTPAPSADALVIAKDYKSLGKPDEFQKGIPSEPIRIGDKLDALSAALREEFLRDQDSSSAQKPDLQNVEVKLVALTDVGGTKVGNFDVALKMTMAEGPFEMVMDLKGKLEVRVDDSLPSSLKLEGPIAVGIQKKPGDKAQVTGNGHIVLSTGAQYSSPQ